MILWFWLQKINYVGIEQETVSFSQLLSMTCRPLLTKIMDVSDN